jgi:hypothetical protein
MDANNSKKENTRLERQDKRTMEESALRNLFKKHILPASFKSSSRGSGNIGIPDAYSYMREFPVSTILDLPNHPPATTFTRRII